MRDKSRPHRYPTYTPDGDYIAWKCVACGDWISVYGPRRNDCPVNWRATGWLHSIRMKLRPKGVTS